MIQGEGSSEISVIPRGTITYQWSTVLLKLQPHHTKAVLSNKRNVHFRMKTEAEPL
jgi:hypothetical protein